MRDFLIGILAVIIAAAVAIWYFFIRKTTTAATPAGIGANQSASSSGATAPSTDMGMNENTRTAQVESPDVTTPGVIGEAVTPIISGSKFTQNPDGTVVAIGGYYSGMSAEFHTVGDNPVPVAATSTGATVGIPTSSILAPLARNEYGGFIYAGTLADQTAQKAAVAQFKASLLDPDIQSKIPGVYTVGDYRYWNGEDAAQSNGWYINNIGEIPYTADYQALMAGNPTSGEVDALKKKSAAEMKVRECAFYRRTYGTAGAITLGCGV